MRCRNPLTCTVVERDKASEGLLASGDERMENLIEFRESLRSYEAPANSKNTLSASMPFSASDGENDIYC